MRILPVIDRIQSACPIYLTVDVPNSLDMVDEASDTPAAFAFWVPSPSVQLDRSMVTAQKIYQRLQVMTVALAVDGVTEPLADAREQLLAALIGWQPTAAHAPMTHEEVAVHDIRGGLYWVRDVFQTHIYQRSS